MSRPCNVKETELGAWMRAVTPAERLELARYCRTDPSYLKTLAGVHRENPSIRLAMALVAGVNIINYRHDILVPAAQHYPKLTLAGLAAPTRRDDALPMELLCKD